MNNILNTNISIEDILSLVTKKKEIKSMELNSALNLYLKIMEPNTRPDTRIYYVVNLNPVFDFFFYHNVKETKDIQQDIIDKYVKYALSKGNKPITINKRIGILQTMLKRLNELNIIDIPSFKYTKIKETKVKIEPVKKEDIKLILKHIDEMKLSHQLMIYLLIGTGIRRNELVNIKTANINFINKSIYLDFTNEEIKKNNFKFNPLNNL